MKRGGKEIAGGKESDLPRRPALKDGGGAVGRGGKEIDVARGERNRCLEATLPKKPCHAPLRSTSESATRLAAPSSRMEAGRGGEARRHLFGDCCISNCQNSSTSRAYSTQKGDTGAPFSGGACSGEEREERHG